MSGPIILPWKGVWPKIADDAFIAPNATIIGDVEIASKASIWFGCVVRGDVNYIRVGQRSNIQDGAIVHAETNGHPTIIGDDVLIGHLAVVHACTLESGCFVGMTSTLLDGAVVESQAMVAAGALIGPGKRVPSGQLWAGTPARFIRDLKPEEIAKFPKAIARYVELSQGYRAQGMPAKP